MRLANSGARALFGRPATQSRLSGAKKLIAETRAAVEAEESSSEKGAEARTLAIESLDLFDRSQGATRGGTNALAQGKRKAGFRLFDTADELFEQAGRKSRRAEKLLNQAT